MELTDERLMSIMPEHERTRYATLPPDERIICRRHMPMAAKVMRVEAECAKILTECGLSVDKTEEVLDSLKKRVRSQSAANLVRESDEAVLKLSGSYFKLLSDSDSSSTENV